MSCVPGRLFEKGNDSYLTSQLKRWGQPSKLHTNPTMQKVNFCSSNVVSALLTWSKLNPLDGLISQRKRVCVKRNQTNCITYYFGLFPNCGLQVLRREACLGLWWSPHLSSAFSFRSQFSGYFSTISKLTCVISELFHGILIAGKHFYMM